MRKIIQAFDLFPALPTLRVQGEPEVSNICGGIFSLAVFAIFIYVFIASTISIISLERITATEMTEMKSPNSVRISNITMAVGLQASNLLQLRNIFQFRAFILDKDYKYTEIQTYPCTRQMWKEFNDQKYKSLNLATHLCIQKEGVEIWGENGAYDINAIYLNLTVCNNATSPITCASVEDMEYFFNTSMIDGRYMACSFVILDSGINPTAQNPITYTTYDKTLWILFSPDQMVIVQTYLGTYEIDTDVSFLPFQQIKKVKGYFVQEATIGTIFNSRNYPLYIQIFVMSSAVKRAITRTYGKFDEVLSYVGGLYGIVISLLAIFMMSYNRYKYELRVAEGMVSFEGHCLAREQRLNFFVYLKYVVYDWCQALFCFGPAWRDCKAIDKARQEAVSQIDAKTLLKRINHLQKVIGILLKPENQIIMHIAQPNSIQYMQNRRNVMEYCQRFSSNEKSITISQMEKLQTMENPFRELSTAYLKQQSSSGAFEFLNLEQIPSNVQNNNNDHINTLQSMNSFIVMQDNLNKYIHKFEITDQYFIDLSQQDIKAEQELANAFYSLQQDYRIKIIKKIPLGILYRFRKWKDNQKELKNKQSHQIEYNEDMKNVDVSQPINLRPLKIGNRKTGQMLPAQVANENTSL